MKNQFLKRALKADYRNNVEAAAYIFIIICKRRKLFAKLAGFCEVLRRGKPLGFRPYAFFIARFTQNRGFASSFPRLFICSYFNHFLIHNIFQ